MLLHLLADSTMIRWPFCIVGGFGFFCFGVSSATGKSAIVVAVFFLGFGVSNVAGNSAIVVAVFFLGPI